MKLNSTLALLLCAGLVGGFIWFFERKAENTVERKEQAGRALRLDPDRVTSLTVESGDVAATCEKRGEGWEIVQPLQARADAGEIDRILWGLETLERSDVITAREQKEQGLDPLTYGLGEPRGRIVLGAADIKQSFDIGRSTPLGRSVYLREEGHEEIIVADAAVVDLLPAKLSTLRDRTLFTGTLYDVTRIDLHRPSGFLQLAKEEDGRWRIEQPLSARASGGAASLFLEYLFAARIKEFVADDVADPAAYGLGESTLSVSLWENEATEGQTLELGGMAESSTNDVYAKLEAYPSVYAVPAVLEELLTIEVNDLRDRRLLTGRSEAIGWIALRQDEQELELERDENGRWFIVTPVSSRADQGQVEQTLAALTETRIRTFLDDLGTNTPWSASGPEPIFLELAPIALPQDSADEEEGASVEETVVILQAQTDTGCVVSVVGETGYYEIDAALLKAFSLDHLFYRDRDVLSLAYGDVRAVTVTRDGVAQSVERDAEGVFVVRNGEAGEVDQDAVEDILSALQNIRALRYVAEDPDDPGLYGLADPVCTLTLGLTGEAGIEKTILFGDSADEGGVFAMIRGADVVFVVEDVMLSILRRDLYTRPPVE